MQRSLNRGDQILPSGSRLTCLPDKHYDENMKRPSRETADFLREAGQRGGKARARRLTDRRRSEIASRAALARWRPSPSMERALPSVRLVEADLTDPVYLAEILSEGNLRDWSLLRRRILDKPFGETAQALEKVLRAEPIYGVAPLWIGLLRSARGGAW